MGQAIGRARRFGQARDVVHVWRFITANTVEQVITKKHQAALWARDGIATTHACEVVERDVIEMDALSPARADTDAADALSTGSLLGYAPSAIVPSAISVQARTDPSALLVASQHASAAAIPLGSQVPKEIEVPVILSPPDLDHSIGAASTSCTCTCPTINSVDREGGQESVASDQTLCDAGPLLDGQICKPSAAHVCGSVVDGAAAGYAVDVNLVCNSSEPMSKKRKAQTSVVNEIRTEAPAPLPDVIPISIVEGDQSALTAGVSVDPAHVWRMCFQSRCSSTVD